MYTESGYNPKRRKSRHDLSSIYSKQCKIKAGINCELIESSNVAQCKTSKETIKNNKTTLNTVTTNTTKTAHTESNKLGKPEMKLSDVMRITLSVQGSCCIVCDLQ